jgi:ligand-binding SRPBCC domain-containing protein
MAAVTITFTTALPRPAEEVWAHATSLAGINAELEPLLRIATPHGVTDLASLEAFLASGRPLSAMLMLGGIVPLSWWEPTLERFEGRHFVERSTLPWLSLWRHEREVRETADGCEVIDRITFSPRFPWPEPVVQNAVQQLFKHRHKRLRDLFGRSRG